MVLFAGVTAFILTKYPTFSTSPSSRSAQGLAGSNALPKGLLPPIDNALLRITKKSFGVYVAPANSPVSPERFKGYHTGVDFETYPAEKDLDVSIYAACTGLLRLKKWAAGYGGVLREECRLDNQAVTIVYGHVKLSSVTSDVGRTLTAGEKIAILGAGYSSETDGERKHLHFGIHRGTAIDIRGYVQNETELKNWLDPQIFFR